MQKLSDKLSKGGPSRNVPSKKILPWANFYLVSMQLRSHADTQPVKRFKRLDICTVSNFECWKCTRMWFHCANCLVVLRSCAA